jgi:hypothetical protein
VAHAPPIRRRTILTTAPWRSRSAFALAQLRITPGLAIGFEVAAVAALLVLAAAVRADDFMVVPRLSEETLEVALGLRLAREGGFPLIGLQPYTGGLFTYLVAVAFLLVGPKIEAGRLLVMTTGVLTVLPTYLLGRDLGQALWSPPWERGLPARSTGAARMAALPGDSYAPRGMARGRLVGLIAALLFALSGPHIATSSRIAYSNSLTPLFTVTALWLAHRAIVRRSNLALLGCAAALGLALQTHLAALTIGPGIALALLLPMLRDARRGGLMAVWPRPRMLLLGAGAGLLMVSNLLAYNLLVGPVSVTKAEWRVGRYVGESAWTLSAWGDRLADLLKASALAISGYTSEVESSPDALLSPVVIVSVGLALLGLWVSARRGTWLPLLVTASVLLFVSLLNGRVEPIVPRVRHYVTLVPLGTIMIGVGLVWLYDRVCAWQRPTVHPAGATTDTSAGRGVWLARAGLLVVPLLLAGGSLASYNAYEAERLSRPDKNNSAYLAVLNAIAISGGPGERVYLDDQLAEQLTMTGGRMLTHLRYAFTVIGQELDTIELDDDRLPIGQRGTTSRRLILSAETVGYASRRYRLVPLPGEPGEGAPLRAFRAFPRRDR